MAGRTVPRTPATGERRLDHVSSPGAEPIRSVAARVYAAMAEIVARPCEWQIILTHGGTLTYLVACWIGMPIESVGQVAFRSVSVALGDSWHLKP